MEASARKELVEWINHTIEVNLSKIEDTASGAIACLLLDMIHPGIGKVPVNKINWAAKEPHEFIANYKILATCFAHLQIDKFIDVNRLIQSRAKDNFEFMAWFRSYFDTYFQYDQSYSPVVQRLKGKGTLLNCKILLIT